MKKTSFLATLATALIFLVMSAGTVGAEPKDPRIQERFQNQQERIDKGLKTGKLTPAEARLVQDNLNRIKRSEARLKADGKLTGKERDRLQDMLDQNSRMIAKEAKNAIRKIE